ncbi:unnamed protein product [Arabis nemorensis]|uniref:Uncharacterized protein n=1 Tax=Arabis nemorensis TaxID=586526 RepID=A0A565BL76_9BRAS|nr:unnamed protein product [Arabis nemorensis]
MVLRSRPNHAEPVVEETVAGGAIEQETTVTSTEPAIASASAQVTAPVEEEIDNHVI